MRKAAEQGQSGAQYNLGFAYFTGAGVPQNDSEAVTWFRKAAEQGSAKAQMNLGRMYEAGRGISRDTVEAYMWFSLSTAAGNDEARSKLSDLVKRMTPAQIAEGKRQADAWLAQHQRR
jgi:TPR repeat protein